MTGSDRQRYKYFSRLVPSDGHQVDMFMELLLLYNWTYISLLYSDGSYGENAAKKTERAAVANQVCILYQKRIPPWADREVYDTIAADLASNSKARVILTFLEPEMAVSLFAAMSRSSILQFFFLLCGDYLAHVSGHIPGLSGAIYASGVMEPVPGFQEYYGSLSPWNVPSNPWIWQAWSDQFSCSWDTPVPDGEVACDEFEHNSDWAAFEKTEVKACKIYEGVQVYALALHALITDRCPDAFQDQTLVDDCIDGADLLDHIRKVEVGNVHFDSIGDLVPVFDIKQVFYHTDGTKDTNQIGRWDKSGGLNFQSAIEFQWMDGIDNFEKRIPESVCSKLCGPKEYAFQMEQLCCWECRQCRNNEIISNGSGCEPCPQFTWPDNVTQTHCELINATFLKPGDAFGLSLLALSAIGISLSLVASALFVRHREHKLVKASSRELIVVTLFGVVCAFSGVLAFVVKPTWLVCWLRISVFSITVSMIFSPILVKAVRIYRLFRAGRNGKGRPKFTSSSAQIGLTGVLISIQVRVACMLPAWKSESKF